MENCTLYKLVSLAHITNRCKVKGRLAASVLEALVRTDQLKKKNYRKVNIKADRYLPTYNLCIYSDLLMNCEQQSQKFLTCSAQGTTEFP